MEDYNTITYKGETIANHFWDKENKKWLIVFEEGLSIEDLNKFQKEISEKAHELNLEVEFKNAKEDDKKLK